MGDKHNIDATKKGARRPKTATANESQSGSIPNKQRRAFATTKKAANPKAYGGVFPYPSQWTTIFAVARDDMGLLFKQECELGLTQARLLYEVRYHRHKNRVSDIAQTLYIKRTTAANAVKQLCSRGLLEETVNEADGRSRILTLTSTGNTCAAQMDKALSTYMRRLKEILSYSQLKTLMRVGRSIAQSNDATYTSGNTVLDAPTYMSGAAIKIAVLTELSRSLGFSFVEMRLLSALITMSGPPRINTLSSRLSLRQNEVTVAVDALEAKGCVTRFADPADGRAVRIYYTEYGYKACTRFATDLIPGITSSSNLLDEVPYPATARLFPNTR